MSIWLSHGDHLYLYLSVGRLFRDKKHHDYQKDSRGVCISTYRWGGYFETHYSNSNPDFAIQVSLPIGGEVISRLLNGLFSLCPVCISTYRWGGYFETCDFIEVNPNLVLYLYLSVGRLFRDFTTCYVYKPFSYVSLPIGGEVISRLSPCLDTKPRNMYLYLSVGRLFRDNFYLKKLDQ